MANEKKPAEKYVAVKARALSPNGFWRCGKQWGASGSVHLLEPTDLARLRNEPAIVVMTTGSSEAALADADAKAATNDKRLLEAAQARTERKAARSRVTRYTKPESVQRHLDEIEEDIDDDGVTEAEAAELSAEHGKLSEILESLKGLESHKEKPNDKK